MSASTENEKPVVQFKNVDIVFGAKPRLALPFMDEGKSRSEIQETTGQVLGVSDCTLDVHKGEIVVLMGLSGSGKSTLLRAVNGLNPVVRGSVNVRGKDGMVDVTNATPAELRRIRQESVAMVFQQFGLLPWRSVRENVGLGLELSGMAKAERNVKVETQLELVGLSDWADRKVGDLSGGMQQRVGLARAFATDAPILLMDEPFSALDPLIRREMQDEFLRLQEMLGKTIVFITHDFDEALRLADRIAIMKDGVVEQCDTPDRIVLSPQTPYVAKFTEEIDKARVVHASGLAQPLNGQALDGAPLDGSKTIQQLARQLVSDPRELLPVAGSGGAVTGVLNRQEALNVLLGDAA